MQDLATAFRNELGVDLPLPLPPECHPLIDSGGLLVGTPIAARKPLLTGDPNAIRRAANGYFLAGFWGHGSNSHAFYWCVADERQRVYLRLPYGGAYMDPKSFRNGVLDVLRSYAAFWNQPEAADVDRLYAVSSMGSGEAQVRFRDGTYASRLLDGFFDDPFMNILTEPRTTEPPKPPCWQRLCWESR